MAAQYKILEFESVYGNDKLILDERSGLYKGFLRSKYNHTITYSNAKGIDSLHSIYTILDSNNYNISKIKVLVTRDSRFHRNNVENYKTYSVGDVKFLNNLQVTIKRILIGDIDQNQRISILAQLYNNELINITKLKDEIEMPKVAVKKAETTNRSKTVKQVKTDKFFRIASTIEKAFAGQEVRLQGVLKKRKETLEQFIVKFFTKFNLEKDTIFVNTLEVQTSHGKRRSLGDIYMICKYYYPDVTVEEIAKIIYTNLRTHRLRSSFCYNVKKRVWYYSETAESNVYDEDVADEYGHKWKYYIDKLNSTDEE